ncbi:peptidase family M48-domain-containing protein [Entophlyctis helioformis]|nr:peptidase family M48-domain-containing protein [Entophlyctis helioformis]
MASRLLHVLKPLRATTLLLHQRLLPLRTLATRPPPRSPQRRKTVPISTTPAPAAPPPEPTARATGANGYEYFGSTSSRRLPFYRRPYAALGATAAAVFLAGYIVTHLETVPISGRTRFNDVSPATEALLGDMAYRQVMAEVGPALLPANHPYSLFVARVARRLIAASGLNAADWQIHVVNDAQRNAFVLPGGKIFVFTGILPIVQTEDGMAAVLGHEMAHQLARHSVEKFTWTKILVVAQILFVAVFGPSPFLTRAITDLGIMRPFSRKCESEADFIGLQLMAKACYDPHAAVAMWQRMSHADVGQDVPKFLSTHPSHSSRIDKIREWMPQAEETLRDSNCGESADEHAADCIHFTVAV